MGLEILTKKELIRWKEVLSFFSDIDVYYFLEYVEAFECIGDGFPICIYFEEGDFKAVNVVMKRKVPNPNNKAELNIYFDYVTPYGYGGFIVNDPLNELMIQRLEDAYVKHCKENNIVSEFVRFHPVIKNADTMRSLYQVVDLGHTVCIPLTSPEDIWNQFTSNCRKNIRKANKNDISVHIGFSQKLFEEFEAIYNENMRRVNAVDYYFFTSSFYECIRQKMKENATIFYTQKDDVILSMAVVMFCGTQMHYHLGASKKEYQVYAPMNKMFYAMALWGYEHGLKTLHLGGGLGSREDSLYHFKKEFNRGEDTRFSIGKRVFLQDVYDRLCEEVNADPEASFFPRYRA